MKRAALLPIALLLAACASSRPAATPSAVKVVVTADPTVSRYVRGEKLAQVVGEALRKYASDAPPATVAIHFTGVGTIPSLSTDQRFWSTEVATRGHAVPIVSSQPWTEPAQPTTSSPRPVGVTIPNNGMPALEAIYTITDAKGTVLERRPLFISLDYGDGYSNRLQEQRVTAGYLAKRVAKLTKKAG